MSSTPTSVLVPPPQPLALPLVAAVALHLLGVGVFAAWELVGFGRQPVLDLSERSLQVEYAVIKYAPGLPQLATVAPRPRGAPEPAPSPAPAPEPPPVESDLVVHTPQAAPQPQGTPDRSAERDRARREALMRAALEGARPGDRDQEATDPRGTADETIRTGSGGIPADPELARWKARAEDQFNDPFNPLPTIVAANPGITAVYRVTIDPRTGRVIRWQVLRSSGNASYDAAVERAIASVPAIDPPPERFIDVVGSVLDVTFEPKGR